MIEHEIHTRRLAAALTLPADKKDAFRDAWMYHRGEMASARFGMHEATYSPEEALTDALHDLPTAFMARRLIELMRPKEVRIFAEGMLIDCTEAVKTLKPLECANAINDWVATAEEMITNRRTQRSILAAREAADASVKQTEAVIQ